MKKTIIISSIGGVFLLFLLIFVCNSLSHVDKHECGYVYDKATGSIEVLERDGWFWRWWPRYSVHTIDERPYQISITANLSVGQRVLNAKLVRFNPEGLEKFIEWHGRTAGSNAHQLQEILKCYAFDKDSGASCPFITVLQEIEPTQAFEADKVTFNTDDTEK